MGVSEKSRHSFLFADLSGFTALTEAHGDEEAADLVGECPDRYVAERVGAARVSEPRDG